MWKPIYQPEPWPQYLKKRENIGVPLMEVRKKYLEEQLLFENYISQLNTLNTVNTLSPSTGGAGGPKPGSVQKARPGLYDKILAGGDGVEEVYYLDKSSVSNQLVYTPDPGSTAIRKIIKWFFPIKGATDGYWVTSLEGGKAICNNSISIGDSLTVTPANIIDIPWEPDGENPCFSTFKSTFAPGASQLYYPLGDFEVVIQSGDASADFLSNGDTFSTNNTNIGENWPSTVYECIPGNGYSFGLFMEDDGASWKLTRNDLSIKDLGITIATGGDRSSFFNKTFTSNANATGNFTFTFRLV